MTATRTRKVSQRQAMATYNALCKYFHVSAEERTDHPVKQGENDPGWDVGPVLCKNFESWSGPAYPWAIVWEGGVYDWPMIFPGGGIDEEYGINWPKVELPKGVWVEAINGYSLSIHVKDW